MVDLNDNHKRHLLSTFRYLDEVLDQAEHIMASSRSRTAFPRYVLDTAPVQRKVLVDYFARFREALLAALPDLALVPGTPEVSTLHALRVQIIAADIALEDTSASSMRGYGPLSAEATAALERVVAELRGQLQRIGAFLEEPPDRDLQARLERLAATTDEARLVSELERVITAHGLVELRPALAVLVERMESRRFEVGVFGRVSSGKSSLLNHVLRHQALPVGVTPITAVPTRVRFGADALARVSFADHRVEVIPLSRIAEFATEQQNPGNRKHVTYIAVELPEPRLESGVVFVDTPGLGSLATAGAEETMAYLPRCDLGIVLVDASSGPSPHDLTIVRALYQSGATAAVLVSKADLLTPMERDQVAQYVRALVTSECGADVTVSPVSVVGPAAALAEKWFEEQLLPLCQVQEKMAAVALRRKVGALRDATTATLRLRLEHERSESPRAREDEAAQAMAAASALFDAARTRCEVLASGIETLVGPVIEEAASATADRWQPREERARVAQEALAEALARQAQSVAAEVSAQLTGLRAELSRALEVVAAAVPWASHETDLPRVAGLPVLDDSALKGPLELTGSFLDVLGKGLLRRRIVALVNAQLAPSLRQALQFHRRRLVTWSREVAAALERTFEAHAGALQAQLGVRGGPSTVRPEEDPAAINRDLEVLSGWGQGIQDPVASTRARPNPGGGRNNAMGGT